MNGDNLTQFVDNYRFLPYYAAQRGFCGDLNPSGSTDTTYSVGFPDWFAYASHFGPAHNCSSTLPKKNNVSDRKQVSDPPKICRNSKGDTPFAYLKIGQSRETKAVWYYDVEVLLDDIPSARAMQFDLSYDVSNARFVKWIEGDIFEGNEPFAVIDRQEQGLVDIAIMSHENEVSRGNFQIGTARFEALDGKEPAVSIKSLYVSDENWTTCSVVRGKEKRDLTAPSKYDLVGNTPNPFNPATTIVFELPRRSIVTMSVFDVTGRLIRRVISSEFYDAGRHSVVWDGKSDAGRDAASGVYFCKMHTDTYEEVQRMTLVR